MEVNELYFGYSPFSKYQSYNIINEDDNNEHTENIDPFENYLLYGAFKNALNGIDDAVKIQEQYEEKRKESNLNKQDLMLIAVLKQLAGMQEKTQEVIKKAEKAEHQIQTVDDSVNSSLSDSEAKTGGADNSSDSKGTPEQVNTENAAVGALGGTFSDKK